MPDKARILAYRMHRINAGGIHETSDNERGAPIAAGEALFRGLVEGGTATGTQWALQDEAVRVAVWIATLLVL